MAELQTPVAIFLFNRPDLTRQVFATVRAARPTRLFLIADGPRLHRPEDQALCMAARAAVAQVDWPCHVERNYADTNLGCDARIISGLDWLFSQVEEAIILEDDVLPDASFFPYCQALLAHYREHEQVLGIGGYNVLGRWQTGDSHYVIHRLPAIYGWATWRRAWRHYDPSLARYQGSDVRARLTAHLPDAEQVDYRWQLYSAFVEKSASAWDIQLSLTCCLMGGYWISPAINLVTNLGFDARATRTKMEDDLRRHLHRGSLPFPLLHPDSDWQKMIDDQFDRWVHLFLILNTYRDIGALWAWQRAMERRPTLALPGIVDGGRSFLAPLRRPAELLAVLEHGVRFMDENPRLNAMRAELAKLVAMQEAP